MLRILAIILTGILTSFYFFPFEFAFLPGANTKMIMAGLGLVILVVNMARGQRPAMDKDFFQLSLCAIGVSLSGLISVTLNDTHDYTYASYIVSMWVWLGGAYTVIQVMRRVHGGVSIELVANYLIAVCVAQCVIAFTMDQYAPLKQFVDSFLASEGFMGKVEDRIYGIGASLDVAGMRFAAVLTIIISLCLRLESTDTKKMWLYIISFSVIVVIGNMIGRTTTVGAGIALCYALLCTMWGGKKKTTLGLFWKYIFVEVIILIPIVVYLYNTNVAIHNNLRFAFEGFFSLWEKGKWQTNSNSILADMFIFPDNVKTWLIGDGYFDNPFYANIDPYFIGEVTGGFYKGTDVGYCRFLFYFGLMGLGAFMFFMYRAMQICWNRFGSYRIMFLIILLLNYMVWVKVSSDLFLVFAIFLCVSKEENDEYELKRQLEIQELENGR